MKFDLIDLGIVAFFVVATLAGILESLVAGAIIACLVLAAVGAGCRYLWMLRAALRRRTIRLEKCPFCGTEESLMVTATGYGKREMACHACGLATLIEGTPR